MPPKKGKRGKQQDSDSDGDFVDPLAHLKGKAVDDDSGDEAKKGKAGKAKKGGKQNNNDAAANGAAAGKGGKRGKGGAADSDDEDANNKGKKGGKGKNKKHQESDFEDAPEPVKQQAGKKKGGDGPAQPVGGGGKKDKKGGKGKKGRQQDSDSDDFVDPVKQGLGAAASDSEDDSEDEAAHKPPTPPPVAKPANKKDNKKDKKGKGKKGKQESDSEDDFVDPVKNAMEVDSEDEEPSQPVKQAVKPVAKQVSKKDNKAKGKKGKAGKDSDSDDFVDPVKEGIAADSDDESEEEVEHRPPTPPPAAKVVSKKDSKKDKKGKGKKGRQQSDDEVEPVENTMEVDSEGETSRPTKQPPKSVANAGKKDKKAKGKKGKRGGDSDSDDFVDPVKRGVAAAVDSDEDSEDEVEHKPPTPPPVSKPASKKDSKKDSKKGKGKKGKQESDSEDDFVDPVKHAMEVDSEEEESSKHKPVVAKQTSKKDKKAKGKKGKAGKDSDSDDFVDPVKQGIAAAADSDEDSEDQVDRKPPTPPPVAKSASKKDSKKDKKGKSKKGNVSDSEEAQEEKQKPVTQEVGNTQPSKKDKKGKTKKHEPKSDSDEQGGADSEIDSDEEKVVVEKQPAPTSVSKSVSKKDKRSKKGHQEAGSDVDEKQNSDNVVTSAVDMPASSTSAKENGGAKSPPRGAKSPPKKVDKLSDGLGALSLAPLSPENAPASMPPAPPIESAPPAESEKAPKKKLSKLEKKLEEAKKLREAADAAAGLKAMDVTNDGVPSISEAELAEIAEKERKEERKKKKEAERERLNAAEEKEEDDVDYYGSDHEDRDGTKGETAEQALERLVLETEERTGKKITARQRKKLAADVEAVVRTKQSEKAEASAHREGAQFACSQTTVSDADQTWQNSLDVIIPAFTISAMEKTLFKDSPLLIGHGRKYGLVGPNGAGKSTLLKMIASKALKIPPRIDCLYVEQEVVADETPAVQAVMKADTERWDLLMEEKRVDRALRNNPEDDALNAKLGEIHEQLAALGADVAESKARRILYGLGFDEDMQVKATKHFSGGWRMRISLARALFMEPTLLMLDEPTNHLDLNAVIWLDDYLQKWKKTLLVVSHDQDFLNSVCEEILHLEDQKVVPYKGNYDQFKEMEAQRRKVLEKEWEKQQKKLVQLKKSGSSKGKAEDTIKKNKTREPGAGKKKKNDAIAAGQEAVDEMSLIKRPREYLVTMHFPPVSKLTPPIIEVKHVSFKYGPTLPTIFSDVEFGIDMDSRICIVGPNGAGKTTLLKMLTGDLEPTDGEVRRNPRLRAGVYNQHFVDRLPMESDPVSYLRGRHPDSCDYQGARNLLGKFGLEGHAHTIKMRDLSGGQKARVVFCDLQLSSPHILFLDEPTNNLDIESIDALCAAVREFDGGVVVVTHDARLIESTECRLWIVDKGAVIPWEGEFQSYKAALLQELEDKHAQQEARRSAHAAAKKS